MLESCTRSRLRLRVISPGSTDGFITLTCDVVLFFPNPSRTIAYRAGDISKRLEPQELYNREELEESVQFDVSAI